MSRRHPQRTHTPAADSARVMNEPFTDKEADALAAMLLSAADLTPDRSPQSQQQWLMGQEYINKALDTDVYGGRKISYINRYDRYQQLEQVSPRVGAGLSKLGYKLRGPEFKLFTATDAGLPDEIVHGQLQDAQQFVTDLALQERFASWGRLMARDGTVPVLNTSDKRAGNGEGITRIDEIPMSHCTLLPRDVQPMSGFQNVEQLWEYGTIVGDVTQCIINERMMAKREIHYLKNGRITLIRFMHHGFQCRDIFQRRTIGIYGMSLMDLMDQTTIKPWCDVVFGYSKAIGRYGFDRLHIESTLIAKLVELGKLTPKQASVILSKEQMVLNNLEPNRDLLTYGKTVNPVNSTFGNASGVVEFLEKLEKDVSYTLCETEAGSGKAAGTTHASAMTADTDNNRVLDGMRLQIKIGMEELIHRHLTLIGWDSDDVAAVKIELQPMNLPTLEITALLNYNAQAPPGEELTREQLFQMCGLTIPAVPSVSSLNAILPNPPQQPERPGIEEPEVPALRDNEKGTFYLPSARVRILGGGRLYTSHQNPDGEERAYLTREGLRYKRPAALSTKLGAAIYDHNHSAKGGKLVTVCGCEIIQHRDETVEEAFERETGIALEAAVQKARDEAEWETQMGWQKALEQAASRHGGRIPP